MQLINRCKISIIAQHVTRAIHIDLSEQRKIFIPLPDYNRATTHSSLFCRSIERCRVPVSKYTRLVCTEKMWIWESFSTGTKTEFAAYPNSVDWVVPTTIILAPTCVPKKYTRKNSVGIDRLADITCFLGSHSNTEIDILEYGGTEFKTMDDLVLQFRLIQIVHYTNICIPCYL